MPTKLNSIEIKKFYLEDKMSLREIATIKNCSVAGVRDNLLRQGVPLRGLGGTRAGAGYISRTIDQSSVVDMYVNKKLSTVEIERITGYSRYGIQHALAAASIEMRGHAGRRTEKALGFIPTKEFMTAAMTYFHNVASDAARHYGVKYATWIDWLIKFDIPRQRPGSVLKGRPSHRRHELPINEAVEMSNSGATYEDISKKYDVSYGVVARRMKEIGYQAPSRRIKNSKFSTVSWTKRRVLQQLNITACEICGESRALDFAHIKPDSKGGPVEPHNCLVLCPTHHRLYDSDSLMNNELAVVRPKIDFAKQIYGEW